MHGIAESLLLNIAEALGPDWQVRDDQPSSAGVYLTGPAGSGIFLKVSWQDKERISVTGLWPQPCEILGQQETFTPYFSSYNNGPKEPRITCAMSRGGTAIAGDIERRFFPHYFPLWDKQIDVKRKALETGELRQASLERLGDRAPKGIADIDVTSNPPELHVAHPWSGKRRPSATFTVSTYETLHFDATLNNLTIGQAEAIIAAVWPEGS
jgi:hypothetical protein